MIVRNFLIFLLLLSTGSVVAQTAAVERFDTSGMPSRPTTFVEQQIWDLVKHHRSGNIADAILIQHKLERYYQDKGDVTRAKDASRLAAAAEQSTPGWGEVSMADSRSSGGNGQSQVQVDAPPRSHTQLIAQGAFNGNYYARTGGAAMEKWDFSSNGGFTHTGVASGVGAGTRDFERGTYEIAGSTLTLHVANTVDVYATNRTLGSNRDTSVSTRQSTVRLLGVHGESGIVIDGRRFTPRHGW